MRYDNRKLWIGDVITVLSLFAAIALMIMGGAAFGMAHYQHEKHYDKNYQLVKE